MFLLAGATALPARPARATEPEGPALAVRGVRVERTRDGRRVEIFLSRPPDDLALFPLAAPPRLVIDLTGAAREGATATAHFALPDDLVTGLRASPHDGRLRAVIDLARPAGEVAVHREGTVIVAELRGGVPKPAGRRAAPAPPPSIPPPSPPAPVEARPATAAPASPLAVRDVQVESTATGRRVRIVLSQPPQSERHFSLEDPKRLVIDVEGAGGDPGTLFRYQPRDAVVTEVRAAPREGGLRTVLELGRPTRPARVWWEGAVLVAELDVDAARASAPGQQGDLVGRRVEATGEWVEGRFEARLVRFRDRSQDTEFAEIDGAIDEVDLVAQRLRIGPVVAEWGDATSFTDLAVAALAPGMVLAVAGRLVAPGRLAATTIERDELHARDVVVQGTVASEAHAVDETITLTVLGLPIVVPRTVPLREVTLARHIDERRPAHQLTVSLFDRPLTIGGEVELGADTLWNPTLVHHTRDRRFEPEVLFEPEFLYAFSRSTILFLEGTAVYSGELHRVAGEDSHVRELEREESWLYIGQPLGQLLGGDFGLQLGRQNVRERRAWWWDRDLDAARLYYDHGQVHMEAGVGQELFSTSTEASGVDPEDKSVLRAFGNAAWGWREGHRLDLFALGQVDRSRHPPVGSKVSVDREDPSDADLLWIGGRTSGRIDTGRLGEVDYLADAAWVGGHEVAFDPQLPDTKRQARVQARSVSGIGLDARATWATRLPSRPSLTLGYAFGSGDDKPGQGRETAFRQTGLQLDRERFRGVDRFRAYGALLHPELSNLHIFTGAMGFHFLPQSSVELLYHLYRQVEPAAFVRDADLDGELLGKNPFIGQEVDAVLGMREWEHVDIQVVGAVFQSGPAYKHRGALAEGLFLTFRYIF